MRGILFVLSGPSGVGKGVICRELVMTNPALLLSVSVTTRPPRPGEIEGKSYFFRQKEEFEEMITRGELLEWAKVYDNYYGTPYLPVRQSLDSGCDVLLEIDIQGALSVKEKIEESVLIFIVPPSAEELKARLFKRGADDESVIYGRLNCFAEEMKYLSRYDYVVVNDDLPGALNKVKAIMLAERCRPHFYSGGSAQGW